LRLVTPWSPARTAALDATVTAWTALAAALVASSIASTRAGPRNLAMTGCLSICLAGPMLAWLSVQVSILDRMVPELALIGPLLEVHALSEGGGAPPSGEQWAWIGTVAIAAIAAWSGLGIATLARAHRQRAALP
jgi:hypothetical protein